MLRDRSIVCFAPDSWRDLWRNRHRLLTILARQNRILYVEPRTWLRVLRRRLRTGQVTWRDFFRPRVETVRENLHVYHDPLYLPRIGRRVVGPAIDALRRLSVRRALRRLRMERPILWLVRPDCWDLPGRLGESMVLYQVVDDYLSYPDVTERSRERVDIQERSLGAQADLVVVTSDTLREKKRHLSDRIALVRNGVDARTLEEGLDPGGPIAPELARVPRPIHGYIGGVTEKLDLDLLEKLAARLRAGGGTPGGGGSSPGTGSQGGGSLVFVGSINVQGRDAVASVARLQKAPNVIFTGRKEAELVPAYLRAFDVCLVPYRLGDQALAIDPLKLYEYLAFGKPTVAVPIPSVERFADVLRIARDHDEFLRHAEEAARESDGALAARRRALAAENSWESRAEDLSAAIEEVLAGAEPASPSA